MSALVKAIVATVFAFGLTSCGGGGSSGSPPIDVNDTPSSVEDTDTTIEPDSDVEQAGISSENFGWASPISLGVLSEVDGFNLAVSDSGKAIAATYTYDFSDKGSLDTIRYDPITGWGQSETFAEVDGPVGGESFRIGITDNNRAVVYDKSSPNQLMYIPTDGWQSVRFLRPNSSRFFGGCCDDDRGFRFLSPVGFTTFTPTEIVFHDYDPAVATRTPRPIAIPVYDPTFYYRMVMFEKEGDGEFYAIDQLSDESTAASYIVLRESRYQEGVWSDPQAIHEFSASDALSFPRTIKVHRSANGNVVIGWYQRDGVVGVAGSRVFSAISRVNGVWGTVSSIYEDGSETSELLHISIDNSGHSVMTVFDGSRVKAFATSGVADGIWGETNEISGLFSGSTGENEIKLFTRSDGVRFLIAQDRLSRDYGLSIQQYSATSGWSSPSFLRNEGTEEDVRELVGAITKDDNVIIFVRQGDEFWVSNNSVDVTR